MAKPSRRPSVWRALQQRDNSARTRLSSTVECSIEHAFGVNGELPEHRRWRVQLTLEYDGEGSAALPAAVVAHARLVIVNDVDSELGLLGEISREMSDIAEAIEESEEVYAMGGNNQFVLVEDLVVDPYWRGGGLGPALVLTAARRLGADAIFLAPHALPTVIIDGVCYSDYEGRRPGEAAQRRVAEAYAAAGFSELRSGTWWLHAVESDLRFLAALRPLQRAEKAAGTADARSWYLRRARCQATARAGKDVRRWTVPLYVSRRRRAEPKRVKRVRG